MHGTCGAAVGNHGVPYSCHENPSTGRLQQKIHIHNGSTAEVGVTSVTRVILAGLFFSLVPLYLLDGYTLTCVIFSFYLFTYTWGLLFFYFICCLYWCASWVVNHAVSLFLTSVSFHTVAGLPKFFEWPTVYQRLFTMPHVFGAFSESLACCIFWYTFRKCANNVGHNSLWGNKWKPLVYLHCS